MVPTVDEWRDELERLRAFKGVILVEGKNDKAALEKLGMGNIIVRSGPLFAVVEKVVETADRCVILTDLDEEGRKLYSEFKKGLQRHGVKVDDRFRKFLFRTGVYHIEGMDTAVRHLGL